MWYGKKCVRPTAVLKTKTSATAPNQRLPSCCCHRQKMSRLKKILWILTIPWLRNLRRQVWNHLDSLQNLDLLLHFVSQYNTQIQFFRTSRTSKSENKSTLAIFLYRVDNTSIGLWNTKHKRKTLRKTSTLEMTISWIKAFWQTLAQIFLTISWQY